MKSYTSWILKKKHFKLEMLFFRLIVTKGRGEERKREKKKEGREKGEGEKRRRGKEKKKRKKEKGRGKKKNEEWWEDVKILYPESLTYYFEEKVNIPEWYKKTDLKSKWFTEYKTILDLPLEK